MPPRANRHFILGYVWHITHRCHKKEFLLKFGRDRRRWLWWLFEAKKRFGLSVLNAQLYIDLNMVRVGVVMHPTEWPFVVSIVCHMRDMLYEGKEQVFGEILEFV